MELEIPDIYWPGDGIEYLTVEKLEAGRAYLILSRNLVAGFWDEVRQGFTGVREKFGDRYLFMEYHWDTGGSYGTAKPYKALDLYLPEDVPNESTLGLFCRECQTPVEKVYVPDEKFYSGKRCTGDTHLDPEAKATCSLESFHCAYWKENKEMFDLLSPIDRAFREARRHPETKMTDRA